MFSYFITKHIVSFKVKIKAIKKKCRKFYKNKLNYLSQQLLSSIFNTKSERESLKICKSWIWMSFFWAFNICLFEIFCIHFFPLCIWLDVVTLNRCQYIPKLATLLKVTLHKIFFKMDNVTICSDYGGQIALSSCQTLAIWKIIVVIWPYGYSWEKP